MTPADILKIKQVLILDAMPENGMDLAWSRDQVQIPLDPSGKRVAIVTRVSSERREYSAYEAGGPTKPTTITLES